MKTTRTTTVSLLLVALCAVALTSCDNEAPALQSVLEARIEYHVNDADNTRTQLLQDIRTETGSVDAAFTSFTDVEVANAIITAHSAGAKVRVVGDADFQADEGFQLLQNAGIRVTFGNGELRYLPDPTISPLLTTCGFNSEGSMVNCPAKTADVLTPLADGEMIRPGSMNVMSHNFITVGPRVGWVFAHPQFGGLSSLSLAFRFDSEIMKETFWREFNQMDGGVFATTLTVYNGPVKSSTQWHTRYITEHGEVRARFSPQDRVVKSVIDDIYRARGNVWVMSDTVSEEFLIDALEYKANAGFDVRIMVREAGQDPATLGRLEALGVRFVTADYDVLPTLVLVDTNPTKTGKLETQRAHIVTHPLWNTGAFRVIVADPNDEVEVYFSDYYTDGMMWTLTAYPDQTNPILDTVETGWTALWDSARRAN